ncbi:MAG: oligosaccharide flippase family protein [Planctomycetota bacterium]
MNKYLPAFVSRLIAKIPTRNKEGLTSIGWTGLAQVIGMVVKLGSTLILTRMLAPEAYGILGTAMAVLTTLEWLSDLGIQPALIRHENGDRSEYLNTGWMMGFGRGWILSICAAASAWPLAGFYEEPTLFGVLLVLAMRPALLSMRSPAFPMLRRTMDYRSIFIDEVAMTVIGTACSIAMAFVFRSVWAIVLGTMAGALASVLLSYVLCPMRPSFKWDKEAAADIYGFGRSVFINTLIMAAWLNLDRLLGLKLLTPTQMGLYAIAFNLSSVLEGLTTRVCDVYFSMLAREEGAEAQGRWHQLVTNRIAKIGMPLCAIGLVVSPWVIWILYDPRYHGAGLIFTILLARLMIRAFGQLQFQYLLALARVRFATYAYIAAVIVQVALFWPMVQNYGVVGMAVTVLLSTTVLTLTQTLLLQRMVGEGMKPFVATVVWAIVGMMTTLLVYGNNTLNLTLENDDFAIEVYEPTGDFETFESPSEEIGSLQDDQRHTRFAIQSIP